MALETSDLNDGTILSQTKQVENDKGHIQFKIALPSGRTVVSEFFKKDDARKAVYAWIETVKQQAVADSKAEQEERAAKARRSKMDLERKPGDDKPLFRAGGARVEDTPTQFIMPDPPRDSDYVEVPKVDSVPDTTSVNSDVSPIDPLAFATAQYKLYLDKVAVLEPQLGTYQKGLVKWGIILEKLEESDDNG